VFVSGLGTNLDAEAARRTLVSVGAQIDVSIPVLSALEMMFSVGGAITAEQGYQPRRELMISLKVLR
jgi:hypothetical protein